MQQKLRNYERGLELVVKEEGCFRALSCNKSKNISFHYFHISNRDPLKFFPGVSFMLNETSYEAFDSIINSTPHLLQNCKKIIRV